MSDLGLALALTATLGGAHLEVQLAPSEITVGDRVEVELVVTAAPDGDPYELELPAWKERWGEAEILEVAPLERSGAGDGIRWRQVLTVTAFRPGRVTLPPAELALHSEGTSRPLATPGDLAFEVRSVLAAEEGPIEPRPPEPPRPLSVAELFWWTTGALALGCLAAGAVVARNRLRTTGEARTSDPLADCLSGIGTAAGRSSSVHGFTELSASLRTYLSRRLEVPALESTTPEIARLLEPFDPGDGWERLLARCDEARFCGREPSRETLRASCRQARRLVESLESKSVRPAEDASS